MKRFAAVCCVYDDPTWIRVMVQSTAASVDQTFVLLNDRPWNSSGGDNLETREQIWLAGESTVEIVQGSWASETEQRNAGLEILRSRGYDYCMVVDADEIYDPAAIQRMKQAIIEHPQVDAWYVHMYTYWKSARFRIEPPEQFTPVVFLKVENGLFTENRHVRAEKAGRFQPALAVCHHLSYARSDSEVQKKLARFSHSHEIRPGWYEEVWKGWDMNPSMENLHPVWAEAYKRAVPQALENFPPLLRELIQKESSS